MYGDVYAEYLIFIKVEFNDITTVPKSQAGTKLQRLRLFLVLDIYPLTSLHIHHFGTLVCILLRASLFQPRVLGRGLEADVVDLQANSSQACDDDGIKKATSEARKNEIKSKSEVTVRRSEVF